MSGTDTSVDREVVDRLRRADRRLRHLMALEQPVEPEIREAIREGRQAARRMREVTAAETARIRELGEAIESSRGRVRVVYRETLSALDSFDALFEALYPEAVALETMADGAGGRPD